MSKKKYVQAGWAVIDIINRCPCMTCQTEKEAQAHFNIKAEDFFEKKRFIVKSLYIKASD
ncbi:MAG: hypothetical protein KAS32_04180 [Candidatus Peribacteraceae bacterium]|nr:hypothetical protein [Candidatus Peribacteraceae bacterium]